MSAQGTAAPIIVVEALRKEFRFAAGSRGGTLVAVADAGFEVSAGGALAIVGESGSGKTTLARMLVGLEQPTAGRIEIAGHDRSAPARSLAERRRRAREAQIVFQDPYSSLDPRQSARACLDEVLKLHHPGDEGWRRERISAVLEQVGLSEHQGRVRPGLLSGGQRQRVAIARAIAVEPPVLILDEAVSALDVSIQAQIINLLHALRQDTSTTFVFITHDLAVARHVADEAIVMRQGQMLERGSIDELLEHPQHPYTRALRDCVPGVGWAPHLVDRTGFDAPPILRRPASPTS